MCMSRKGAWNNIRENYSKYIDESRGNNFAVSVDPETGEPYADLPLQSAIQSGKNQKLDRNPGPREHKYLVEFNNSLPSINELSTKDMSMTPIGLADTLKVKVTKDHIVYWEETFKAVRSSNKELSMPPWYLDSIELLVSACHFRI